MGAVSKLKVLDLFSGIGGFSLGLERTGGFETVAFCEIDKKARQVLRKHWPETTIFEDVSTLTAKDFNEQIDVICGGFPCQDISVAGNGAGLAGSRSGLWFQFHRLIEEIKPRYAIIENVAALRSRGLDQVLRSLAEIGYDAEWHCIPASAVGAPHQRDRIWILAYPNDDGWNSAKNSESDYSGNDGSSPRSSSPIEPAGSGDMGTDIRGSTPEVMADAQQPRWEGWVYRWAHTQRKSKLGHLGRSCSIHGQPIENWWATEPSVGRVANGVSGRVDRLKQLGNAVVPQIPELLGYAILSAQ